MDRVPTSIAAALTWFTGQHYYGDEVIDQVYGSGYTGGTAGMAYEAYCKARGVSLFPVNGTAAELVPEIHAYLHQNCPVLVTVPGQWNNPATSGAHPGDVTHVMVVCGDGPGLIQVMNPWTGVFETYSDSWFQVKLCYGQIWPMEGKMSVALAGWTDDGTTLKAPNGIAVTSGFREVVMNPQQYLGWDHAWNPIDWPLASVRSVASVEPGNPSIGPGTRQDFRDEPGLDQQPQQLPDLGRAGFAGVVQHGQQPARATDYSGSHRGHVTGTDQGAPGAASRHRIDARASRCREPTDARHCEHRGGCVQLHDGLCQRAQAQRDRAVASACNRQLARSPSVRGASVFSCSHP